MYENSIYSTGSGSVPTSGMLGTADALIGVQSASRDPQIITEVQCLQKLIEEHNIICANLQQRLQLVLCQRPIAGAEANRGPEPQRAPLAETLIGCNQQLYGLPETYRGILASLEIQ